MAYQKAKQEVKEEAHDPLDSMLSLLWAKVRGELGAAHRPGYCELKTEAHLPHLKHVTTGEPLTWVRSYDDNGKPYPSSGKNAKNYPIVCPPLFDAEAARIMEEYLEGNYAIDEEAWRLITKRQLPPNYQDVDLWGSPDSDTDNVEDNVRNVFPHLYIWMMSARIIPGISPAYDTPWDPMKSLRNDPSKGFHMPPNAMMPPFGLPKNREYRIPDRDYFHGQEAWPTDLCGTDGRYPIPNLIEFVRTHKDSVDELHGGFPIYWILHYLLGARQAPGYHVNSKLRLFLETYNGAWTANVLFGEMSQWLGDDADGSEFQSRTDEMEAGRTGHWYPASEL